MASSDGTADQDPRNEAMPLRGLLREIEQLHADPEKGERQLRASFRSQLQKLLLQVLPLLGEGHLVMPVAAELSDAISRRNVTCGMAWEDVGYIARSIEDYLHPLADDREMEPRESRIHRARIVAGLLREVADKYRLRQDELVRKAVRRMIENCVQSAQDLLNDELVQSVADDLYGILIATDEESDQLNGEVVTQTGSYIARYLEEKVLRDNGGGLAGYGFSVNEFPVPSRRVLFGRHFNR